MPYCSRCDKEVGHFHRCFWQGRNPIAARDKAPDKNKRTSARLLKRLAAEAGLPEIPEAAKPERLNHGHWQRSAGAWSWCLRLGVHTIGSQWTMKQCADAETLQIHSAGFDIDVIPTGGSR